MSDPTDEVLKDITEAATEMGFEVMADDELQDWMAASRAAIDQQEAADRDAGKVFLDEERDRELIDGWYKRAETIKSIEDAADFATELQDTYRHDYGTVCHAIAAAGVAMANAVAEPQGITGFQADAVGWMLHKHWGRWDDGPRKMLEYRNVGSSRVDLQACKLEYSIVSPK